MSMYNDEIGSTAQKIVDIIFEDLQSNVLMEKQDIYRLNNDLISLAAFIEIYECIGDIEEIAKEEGDEAGYDEGYEEGYSEGFAEGYEEAQKNQSVK